MRWFSVHPWFPLPSLTGDAAAKATAHRANRTIIALRRERRGKYGPAEILFEAVVHIGPQLAYFVGRSAVGIDFHHRAAVDHRRGVIGAVVQRDRRSEERREGKECCSTGRSGWSPYH